MEPIIIIRLEFLPETQAVNTVVVTMRMMIVMILWNS
jgi:hypothetical protein